MSTHNRLTIESTSAAPVHLGMLRAALKEHAEWTDDLTAFDGEALDYDIEWRPALDGPGQHETVPHRVSASWESKWAFTTDGKPWADLTAFLGPDYQLRFMEEWDDDGIGRTEQAWCNGTMSDRDSTTLRDVSDALSRWNSALLDPTILTRDQVAETGPGHGDRFLLLPQPEHPRPPEEDQPAT